MKKLLAQPRDPRLSASYSLVPVHVWTNNVTEVRWVAEQLGTAARVLTPRDFVQCIVENLNRI